MNLIIKSVTNIHYFTTQPKWLSLYKKQDIYILHIPLINYPNALSSIKYHVNDTTSYTQCTNFIKHNKFLRITYGTTENNDEISIII